MTPDPPIPSRLSLFIPPATTHHGTLLYIGPVDGTTGIWWGVEWDDVLRGKHSGEKDGKQYFETRVPHSATFIRPPAVLAPPPSLLPSLPLKPSFSLGTSFLTALAAKYLTAPTLEASYALNPEVGRELELVGMEKIAKQFGAKGGAGLKLKIVGLEEEGVRTWRDDMCEVEEGIENGLVNVKQVDLSRNLVKCWEDVADIVIHLPALQELALNYNRLAILDSPMTVKTFMHLKSLHLNKTLISAQELLYLHKSLPALEDLQAAYNDISSLTPLTKSAENNLYPALQSLNLEGNAISSWEDVVQSFGRLPSLERLVLSFNPLSAISSASLSSDSESAIFQKLTTLSITDCPLSDWSSIDALSHLPHLQNLSLGTSPLLSSLQSTQPKTADRDYRAFVIGRLGGLKTLDHSAISASERRDSELWYLGKIEQEIKAKVLEKVDEHPRFKSLVETYGLSERDVVKEEGKGQKKLVSLSVVKPSGERVPLSLLPTTPVRLLRTRVAKVIGSPIPKSRGWKLVVHLRARGINCGNQEFIKCTMEDEKEISWYGVEGGEELWVLKD